MLFNASSLDLCYTISINILLIDDGDGDGVLLSCVIGILS